MKAKRIFALCFIGLLLFTATFGVVAAQTGKVIIFSWWIGGGEEEGLLALFKVFQRNFPRIEIVNATVAGGAGINAKSALQTRMVGGNPPDSFQVHGGAELVDTYVKTGMMEPLTRLLTEWGIRSKFNQQILDMCSYKGQIYSIPLDVHRSNVLWYNKAILRKHNIKPPATIPELIAACRQLSQSGITPLSLGDKNKWEATHLFETILIAELGPVKYNGLWKGKTSFNDPGVRRALTYFKELLRYVNKDHSTLTWQDATKMVFKNKAVFNIMGDWAEGYFKTLGGLPGKDFGWVPMGDSFMVITDSFGLPKNAPHLKGAVAWLKTVASVEGQDIFNPIKGSIPSRLDANRVLYDPYQQKSMDDFNRLILTPSIVHGSAAPQGFSSTMNDIINSFIYDGDIEKALKNINQNVADYLE
ncbi:MAG: ABC transporter substrate-binding protein [Bacillota bacterium]